MLPSEYIIGAINNNNIRGRGRLTDDVEVDEVAHVWRGGYLALVDAAVPVLGVLDLEGPVLRVGVVDRPEALVARVRVSTHGEEVHVPVTHPRYLKRHLE